MLTRGLLTAYVRKNMFEGKVISINITPEAEAPMQSVDEVRAIPGRGLEGDRYFDNKGRAPEVKRELTLIEAEAIEAFKSELDVDYGLSDSRRNVVTRGVPLNHLVGNGLILGYLMYRSALVPPRMALLGLVGGPLLLLGSIGVLFDLWDQTSAMSLLVIPEFIWELFIGIYCTIWGFRAASPILSREP